MLASWRGTRFEVTQVLREVGPDGSYFCRELTDVQVCDNVLKPHSASDLVLFNRAKVFKSSFRFFQHCSSHISRDSY
jgi:hypothetical protein